jgi:hypothetical protein
VLEAEPVYSGSGKERTVDITKFLPSLAEVPSKELEAIKERALKSGMDFIDFWAVDFEWQPGAPFHHDWQGLPDAQGPEPGDGEHGAARVSESGPIHGVREGGGHVRLRHERDGGGQGLSPGGASEG